MSEVAQLGVHDLNPCSLSPGTSFEPDATVDVGIAMVRMKLPFDL